MSRFAPFPMAVALLLFAGPAARGAEIPLDERRSAYEDMSRDNKAMQDDDTSNPGMLAVLDGEALWQAKAGTSGKSCADCHGDATTSMYKQMLPDAMSQGVTAAGGLGLARVIYDQLRLREGQS